MNRLLVRKLITFNRRSFINLRKYSSNEDNDDDKMKYYGKRKPTISHGVKLYPGYQKSQEDLLQEALRTKLNEPQEDAKKAIENFYGLNELEYEKDEDEVDEQEDDLSKIMKKTKRDTKRNAVFDVDSIVNILKSLNIKDLVCIQIPDDLNYANYMVIGTCSSAKHINSSYINFNQIYKRSKTEDDSFVKRSGLNKWCAIDTGNVVVHLFTEDNRELYDLETLWTVGSKYDDKLNDHLKETQTLAQNLTFIE